MPSASPTAVHHTSHTPPTPQRQQATHSSASSSTASSHTQTQGLPVDMKNKWAQAAMQRAQENKRMYVCVLPPPPPALHTPLNTHHPHAAVPQRPLSHYTTNVSPHQYLTTPNITQQTPSHPLSCPPPPALPLTLHRQQCLCVHCVSQLLAVCLNQLSSLSQC
jgi:hypothetical protein